MRDTATKTNDAGASAIEKRSGNPLSNTLRTRLVPQGKELHLTDGKTVKVDQDLGNGGSKLDRKRARFVCGPETYTRDDVAYIEGSIKEFQGWTKSSNGKAPATDSNRDDLKIASDPSAQPASNRLKGVKDRLARKKAAKKVAKKAARKSAGIKGVTAKSEEPSLEGIAASAVMPADGEISVPEPKVMHNVVLFKNKKDFDSMDLSKITHKQKSEIFDILISMMRNAGKHLTSYEGELYILHAASPYICNEPSSTPTAVWRDGVKMIEYPAQQSVQGIRIGDECLTLCPIQED